MTHLAPVWATATTLPIASGSGSWVTTTDGTRYLDFTAGIAVASTGHCHPQVVAAIQEQAATLIHGQVNCYHHRLLDPLVDRLDGITPAPIDTFFFSNSGAEITEAAVKLAKAATGRGNVVVFAGSFHGRTHLAMAMTTSKSGYRIGYSNLPPGVFVAPFPDLKAADVEAEVASCLGALRHLLATQTAPSDTAAIVLEPVIGEGGYLPCPPSFFRGVAELCRELGILFVADEVQTGFGRTGTMFAIERYEVVPDVLMMAKGIASGLPLSALGAPADLMARWPVGSHGGTYGGNPVACAAALATIDVLSADGFLDNVEERGEQLRAGLRSIHDSMVTAGDPGLVHVRGLGLMNAVEFADPARCKAVIAHLLDESRVITMAAGVDGSTLRWMPPLVVTADEVDLALEGFAAAVTATHR